MSKTAKMLNIIVILLIMFYIYVLIAMPEICKNGTIMGILLCGRVIIPALFPFTMCVLFIMNSGLFDKLSFFVVLLSFVGGYPIGAKLLSNAVAEKKLSPEKAGNMLNYCINAGPAFIISAVGNGILGNKQIGVILLISHIISGLILCLVTSAKRKNTEKAKQVKIAPPNLVDNFVKSASDASSTVLGICGFVILFSAINAYISYFAQSLKPIKPLALLLEVTNAVTLTDNIYLISFLLGLGGISVWCQVLSVSGKIKINYLKFIIFRLLHGSVSALLTYLILKLFPVNISVFSNIQSFSFSYFYSTWAVASSLVIMGIVFMVSLSTKKYTGKLLEDIV